MTQHPDTNTSVVSEISDGDAIKRLIRAELQIAHTEEDYSYHDGAIHLLALLSPYLRTTEPASSVMDTDKAVKSSMKQEEFGTVSEAAGLEPKCDQPVSTNQQPGERRTGKSTGAQEIVAGRTETQQPVYAGDVSDHEEERPRKDDNGLVTSSAPSRQPVGSPDFQWRDVNYIEIEKYNQLLEKLCELKKRYQERESSTEEKEADHISWTRSHYGNKSADEIATLYAEGKRIRNQIEGERK